MRQVSRKLDAPVDLASLAVFRIAFGALMCVSALRFMASGWVERFYGERTFFFHYWGFEWVEPWPLWGMYLHYGLIAVAGLLVSLGLFYRFSVIALLLLFTYAELIDVTNYLNHYYLVSLLLLWMSVLPLSGTLSVDARRRPGTIARDTLPRWGLWGVRFQVALVYVYAAAAKAGSDWLAHGQPLNLWLNARRDLPLVGGLLGHPDVALAVGWAGFLHDLLIVPLLLWRRSRVFAYLWLLTFHFGTHLLFNIGIFPFLMPLCATLFFAPDWPRRFFARLGTSLPPVAAGPRPWLRLGAPGLVLLTLFCGVQVSAPLRAHLYGGNVLWHEQGMRWSWRVMVREKQGDIRYRVTLPSGREVAVAPRRYVSEEQERETSGQPDLILQLAHHIADDFAARGQGPVQVRVDALVSLNGRRLHPMIDPDVDLAQIRDGVAPAPWILPAPSGPPPALGGPRVATSWQ